MVYMSIFCEHTNNFVLLLLYSIIIDIFSPPGETISPYLGCCSGFVSRSKGFEGSGPLDSLNPYDLYLINP